MFTFQPVSKLLLCSPNQWQEDIVKYYGKSVYKAVVYLAEIMSTNNTV